MSEGKSCFFIGHREADERILARLETAISEVIMNQNVRYFYVGGYGGFDRITAVALRNVKQKFPDITLMLVLPYHPAERSVMLPDGFDGSYYPDGLENTPKRYAIAKANRIMVDACDCLICYVRPGSSNSRKLLEYAARKTRPTPIHIANIAEP